MQWIAGTALVLGVAGLMSWAAGDGQDPARDAAQDRREIEAHVRSIFEAYLRQDRATIERTHAADWTGFTIPADHVVHGIEEYMTYADASLQTYRGTGYEIHELEVQVHGDVGLVYYTASWRFRDAEGVEGELALRAVDVYRRYEDGWNQAGSNICTVPPPLEDE